MPGRYYVWSGYMHPDREAESTADYLGFYLAMGMQNTDRVQ